MAPFSRDTERAMSQENVEVVRGLVDAFRAGMERGDPGAWFDSKAVADEFEWSLPNPFEGRSVWRGRDGWVEFMRVWTEEFEDYSFRFERFIDAGDDRVVTLVRQRATGKESGAPVESRMGQIWELEDGRAVRAQNYLSYAQALEAAGLSE
jgi:ketosteroid isomerase-like protein